MPPVSSLPPPPAPPERTGWPWTTETPPETYRDPPASGWPVISIVCPSFGQGKFIEETLRSVLLQNYPALEFIVVDGGSRDESVPILRRYSPWLAHWESNPDRGQAHALNKGFDRASGELYGWINSDDYYLPGAFAAVARKFRRAPHSLIFGDWAATGGHGPGLDPRPERAAFAFQVAVGGRTLPSHATFWPRTAHQRLREDLRFTMDAELFKRLAASGLTPRHVAQALAVVRLHPESKTSTIAEVGRAESEAWSRAQPWHTHYLWRLSRLLDRWGRR